MNRLSRKNLVELAEKVEKTLEDVQVAQKAHSEAAMALDEAVRAWGVAWGVDTPSAPRKFKVGDKVRVVKVGGEHATTHLKVGDVTTVVHYKEDCKTYRERYPSATHVRPVLTRESEFGDIGYFAESSLELVEGKSLNEKRAEVIQRAKKFLEDVKNEHGYYQNELSDNGLGGWCLVVEFIVNEEKRTVVALLRGFETFDMATKGIARCHSDDVFNADIGKAIALGRALGKDVSEFENAVQPTIAVGQVIIVCDADDFPISEWYLYVRGIDSQGYPEHNDGTYTSNYLIVSDTNAIYEGEGE